MARPPTVHAESDANAHPGSSCADPADGRTLVELARAAGRGEAAAVGALYRRQFDRVFAAARRASGRDEPFCLDVVQETFVRVLRAGSAVGRLSDDEHVDRWLGCVARSVVLDTLRAEARRARREVAAARSGTAHSLDALADAERTALLERELASLPERDRELLRWRSSGMTLGTIAELVGSTIGAVHGRLRRLAAGLSDVDNEVDHE